MPEICTSGSTRGQASKPGLLYRPLLPIYFLDATKAQAKLPIHTNHTVIPARVLVITVLKHRNRFKTPPEPSSKPRN